MNTRTFLLQVAAPFVGCLLGTLALCSPLLVPAAALVSHSHRTAVVEHRGVERTVGSRVAHSDLPSVVEQLDQIHDNYAQDVQDQALEYRMSTMPAVVLPKAEVDAGAVETAANDAPQNGDPWSR